MSEELTHSEMQKIGEEVVGVLCTIFDPEIPVDIYQLGLIYDVKVSTERDVHIMMTLTSPNCPVAESLPQEVKEKSRALDSVNDVEVEITFDPPWDKSMMSERQNSSSVCFNSTNSLKFSQNENLLTLNPLRMTLLCCSLFKESSDFL
jgi:FeS assembly SUF system protein